MDNTFLTKFVTSRYEAYVEPQRKGTAKGKPIGFSEAKYKASLCMLVDAKLKELAKQLNISYGVIRLWNIEEEFQSLVIQHHLAFATQAVNRLREKYEDNLNKMNEFLKYPLDEIAANQMQSDVFREFRDFASYHIKVKRMIFNLLDKEIERAIKNKDNGYLFFLWSTSDAFLHLGNYLNGKEKAQHKQISETLLNKIAKALIDKAKDILLKKSLTIEDKKVLMVTLNSLEEVFIGNKRRTD